MTNTTNPAHTPKRLARALALLLALALVGPTTVSCRDKNDGSNPPDDGSTSASKDGSSSQSGEKAGNGTAQGDIAALLAKRQKRKLEGTAKAIGIAALASMSEPLRITAPLTSKDDRSLSPYFKVDSQDASIDQLPLKANFADVDIAGVIADVTVTQVYQNEGQKPIEAIYVFPASSRAAVYAMKMTIGERTIVAKIQEREQARKTYEIAKAEGKSASLLEQQRPNVFQMNVANIMPGDVVEVEMRYTELLVPTDGVYEFVYPTVVGPRYSEQPADGAPDTEKWVANPYQHKGEAPSYTFDLTATLSTGIPIQEVAVPTHEANAHFEGPAMATIVLDDREKEGGNRDFILRYRLAGGAVQSGLLLFEGEKENFFLLMNQPPARVTENEIPRREYVFVVDVSGSMGGFPLDVSKALLKDLIGGLRPDDRFNVILFSGDSDIMAEESVPANARNIARAIKVIDEQRGGGGTRLLPALERGLALPRADGCSRSFIVVTDGYISVETQVFDLIRNRLNEANLFAFGIGSSVNRFLIEGMARAGQGEPFVIMDEDEATKKADTFRKYIQSPVLTGVKVTFDGLDVYDVEPPSVPDVMAERPVIVFGKWRGERKGTVRVTGLAGKAPYSYEADVLEEEPREQNLALRYLWARDRIATLGDYNSLNQSDERVKEITELGLEYNLLTAYTSFVAVDSLVRNKEGDSTTVKQSLPLPDGVEESAVGASAFMGSGGASMGYGSGLGGGGIGGVPSGAPMMATRAMSKKGVAPAASLDMSARLAEPKAKTESGDRYAPAPPGEVEIARNKAESIPRAMVDTVQVIGALQKSDVEAVLKRNLPAITACVELAAKLGGFGASGNMTIKLKILANGRVASVETVKLEWSGDHKSLEECTQARLRRLRFPTDETGGETEVTFTVRIGASK